MVNENFENVNSGNEVYFNLVAFNGEQQKGVDARELHEQLQVKTQFKDWIGRRLDECRFIEGQDFCSNLSSKMHGGHNRKNYILSIDAAKHIAMMERNEVGFRVRQYFIKVENCAKELYEQRNDNIVVPQELLHALLETNNSILKRLEKIEQSQANQKQFSQLTNSYAINPISKWFSLEEVADILGGSEMDVICMAYAAGLINVLKTPTHKAKSQVLISDNPVSGLMFSPRAIKMISKAHNG